jgi:hypothetical protein
MKHILIILTLVAFTGCSKLDLVPISERNVEGFYKTPEHINQALIGCYNGLRDSQVRQSYSYMLTESRSDNTFQSLDNNDGNTSRFTETSLLPVLYTAWSNSYNKIQRCNKVLEEIAKIEIPEALAKQYEGEAKFIRALLYFDLVRLWGPVPLVTTSISIQDGYKVVRNSEEEIYKQIDQDLTDAASFLPDQHTTANKGRATKWAAKGFLGKSLVFQSGYPLKKNKWTEAAAIFKEVMDSGRFEFFARFDDVFKHENEAGKQSVFSITFKAGVQGEGNSFPTRNAPNFVSRTLVPFGGSPNMLFVSTELVNSFEAGDLRRDASIWREWLNNANQSVSSMPFSKKYLNGPVIAANDWDIDWIALRYDDVLMLYAECLNEIGYNASGEAFTLMNKFRQRAGLKVKTAAEVTSQAQFRLWVENERRWEFCFENQRWFDLVRTDRALDVMREFLGGYGLAANIESKDRYFYPVPQQVIDVNQNIKQNKGYN